MHDLKLEAVTRGRSILPPRAPDFLACVQTYNAFLDNFGRAVGMLVLPGYLGDAADKWRRATDAVLNAYPRYWAERIDAKAIGKRVLEVWAKLMSSPEAQKEKDAEGMLTTLSYLSTTFPDGAFHAQMEKLLESSVIEMWTSFEVLVGDLLNHSMEEHNECFPPLHGKRTCPSSRCAICFGNRTE